MTVYETIGVGYARQRVPDPRIQARIDAALGNARSVLNVGAGTGSYEPLERRVVALEPSPTMIAQRTSTVPVVQGVAAALPFDDASFDAALAVMTVHHWPDPIAGLRELQRVAARQVILTFDWAAHDAMWWTGDYLSDVARGWRHNVSLAEVAAAVHGRIEVVGVPWDMTDGVLVAHWRRPERYLDPVVRASASGTALADQRLVDAAVARLADDLRSGEWHRRYGRLLDREELDVGLRIVVGVSGPGA